MRYLSAGESHGPGLTAVIEGLPSNMPLNVDNINFQLARRQKGYGRGGRMKIESDRVEILSGLRYGKTLGSPLTIHIKNRDFINWQEVMSPQETEELETYKELTRPRPGHADLSGALKYNHRDIRNVLERASARETAIRTAVGSVGRELLSYFSIEVFGQVLQIGSVSLPEEQFSGLNCKSGDYFTLQRRGEESPVRCVHEETEKRMIEEITKAQDKGDSLGGVFEIIITGLPAGLGSYVHWDRKLDGRLAGALMSLQGIKGVEIGLGFKAAAVPGSQVHDGIFYEEGKGYGRRTNRSGGIEGGMSSGENLILRCAMKPIPTLYKPLESVDMVTKEEWEAGIERSDVCAVPAASVVGEAIAAWEVACAFREKFSGDSWDEVKENYHIYLRKISQR